MSSALTPLRSPSAAAGLLYRAWARRHRVNDPNAVAQVAWARIGSARQCLVVTELAGRPSARVVQPFVPRADWTVEFSTHPNSRKVAEISQTGHCLLVYQNSRRRSCVVLDCDAEVTPWPKHGSPRFDPFWTAFWPRGPMEDEYVVIACHPVALEMWDGTAVVAPEPFGHRSRRLQRVGGAWRDATS